MCPYRWAGVLTIKLTFPADLASADVECGVVGCREDGDVHLDPHVHLVRRQSRAP